MKQSHQNKFHADAIRDLTAKFASIRDGDTVTAADKELWEYFSDLYKNSNKGIKGRGKDRKVGSVTSAPGTMVSRNSMLRSNVGMEMDSSMQFDSREPSHVSSGYDMFDDDDGTGSASHGGSSSTGSLYGADDGRELAFGDRMYLSQP